MPDVTFIDSFVIYHESKEYIGLRVNIGSKSAEILAEFYRMPDANKFGEPVQVDTFMQRHGIYEPCAP